MFFIIVYSNPQLSKNKELKAETFETLLDTSAVTTYVESCLKEATEKSLLITALQGGYYFDYSVSSVNTNPISSNPQFIPAEIEGLPFSYFIPIYLFDGKNSVPSLDFIQKEIASGIKEELNQCLNFSVFPYPIEYDSSKETVNVLLNNEKAVVGLNLPVKGKIEEVSFELQRFNIEIPSNFTELYDAALELTREQVKNNNEICLSCITLIAESHGATAITKESTDNRAIYVEYYLKEKVVPAVQNKNLLAFGFAHKLSIQ